MTAIDTAAAATSTRASDPAPGGLGPEAGDIDDPAGAHEISPQEYYRALTTRNAGVIEAHAQERLARVTVAVLGCGSIGGAAIEPLARIGITSLVLADPGTYELNNLNRQRAGVADLGRNKAVVAAERVLAINPYARVGVEPRGVCPDGIDALVDGVDLIIDGVDVTTPSGLAAKALLHERAHASRLPLITGWDMAGTQYVQVYDYRRPGPVLGGRLTPQELAELPLWEVLQRIIPRRVVPRDMIRLVNAGYRDPDFTFPQLAPAADLFGVLATSLAVRVLTGAAVPSEVTVDAHRLVSPRSQRLRDAVMRPLEAAALLYAMRRHP